MKEKVYCKNCKYCVRYRSFNTMCCTKELGGVVYNEYNGKMIEDTTKYVTLESNSKGNCKYYELNTPVEEVYTWMA